MVAAARRNVTELLKLLPELSRTVQALCELHYSQLERAPLPAKIKEHLRSGTGPPTQTQMQLGIELAQEGPSTVRDLARRLGVTPAAVSLLVDRMAEHGWVERTRDEDDRRVVWVRLTPSAAAICDAMMRVQRSQLETFLAAVPEDEREAFVRNLARFARVMALTQEETTAKAG
jgi:DNA-binding MarR family transcriptional regulator